MQARLTVVKVLIQSVEVVNIFVEENCEQNDYAKEHRDNPGCHNQVHAIGPLCQGESRHIWSDGGGAIVRGVLGEVFNAHDGRFCCRR